MKKSLTSKPVCAVCGVPVQEMLEDEDQYLDRIRFTAVCHGQRESVTLDAEVVEGLKVMGFGLAFASSPRRISA